MDDAGHVVLRQRLTRDALMPFMTQVPPVIIGMEACGGAHYWGSLYNPSKRYIRRVWESASIGLSRQFYIENI
jgi:hypothetical protein